MVASIAVFILFSFSFYINNPEQEFFTELQDRAREFGIADIQLGLATLEEVFLNIARQAELESATAEQRLVTLSLTSGDSLQVKCYNLVVRLFKYYFLRAYFSP